MWTQEPRSTLGGSVLPTMPGLNVPGNHFRLVFEMKIALVSEFPPFHSGFAEYASYLVGALRRLGHEVLAIPTKRNREDYHDVLRSLDDVGRLDVIHLNHGYDGYDISRRFISFLEELRGRCTLIATMHTVNNLRRGSDVKWFNLALADTVDLMIVHSEEMRNELVRQLVVSEKILIIPHGTGIPFVEKKEGDGQAARTRWGLPPGMKMVLCFGFLEPDKGFEELIEAVAEIKDAFLVIAGEEVAEEDDHFIDKLQASADRRLEGRFTLISHYLPETEILQLMSAADAIAMAYRPSSADDIFYSVSGILHLAFGSGKPVVASENPKFGELKRLIPELVVPPMDIQSLKDIIHRVLVDEDFRELAVEKISRYAIETSWDSVAQLYVKAYESAMRARTRLES